MLLPCTKGTFNVHWENTTLKSNFNERYKGKDTEKAGKLQYESRAYCNLIETSKLHNILS